MTPLPLIVGFGGVNPAGRSSFHHGYKRLVLDAMNGNDASTTYRSLAALMGLEVADGSISDIQKQYIRDHTLVRKIEGAAFDVDKLPWNNRMLISSVSNESISFITKTRSIPEITPAGWTVRDHKDKTSRVDFDGETEILIPTVRKAPVQAAGQLPTGFDPGLLYQARSHPRGLQMAVYGASDALMSTGIDWETICERVAPDQISVYAGSAMGQLDQHGHGGMLGGRFNDKRTTSKHCPFGLAEMPADFINAYVLGSLGSTGTYVGACASFLYNLRQAVSDIQTGVARVVMVGSSEAPVVADVMDGYTAMGALATDQGLQELDGTLTADYRRASRPFSSNCGFTMGESSQYIMLMDDELAMELGASIHGAVSDVFVNADGYKKSISSPGVGNYVTVAKAMASARSIIGEEALRSRSYIQAHGTSTPQNRVSESHILNEAAKTFGIKKWPVAAIKAYLGHSLAVSAGDQLMASLGLWEYGVLPGINTIDHIADDVYDSNLQFSYDHLELGKESMDCAILNAKGFGGNNATATVLAPHIVKRMMEKKYGGACLKMQQKRNEKVQEKAKVYDELSLKGEALPIYKFNNNVLHGDDLTISDREIKIPGYEKKIDLTVPSVYSNLLDD